MNPSIDHLYEVAAKKNKNIIGLMSGTSLDGLDVALCEITCSGDDTKVQLKKFKTVAYQDEVKADLKRIASVEHVSLQQLCLMHTWLGDYHANIIMETLREWGIEAAEVDCIASHGQTIYHAPKTFHERENWPNTTLQIIDGDHIARTTGILTISDFRQKHTAAGGEGAPMVALTDELLYKDDLKSRLLLNIGGIANFTYLPAGEAEKESITTDVGPGNTLVDQAMQTFFDQPFDENGAVARQGTVQPTLLQALLDDAFFKASLPRTTGPERFNLQWVKQKRQAAGAEDVGDVDLIATLTWFSAQAVADTIREVVGEDEVEIYLSGGGMYNLQLVAWIEELLDLRTHSFMEIGFNPDAKEAASFAVLANETLSGHGFIINPQQKAGRRVNFGKISLAV